MKLTKNELRYIKHTLIAKKAYRHTNIPLRATVWEPWMESFLQKVSDELEVLEQDQ